MECYSFLRIASRSQIGRIVVAVDARLHDVAAGRSRGAEQIVGGRLDCPSRGLAGGESIEKSAEDWDARLAEALTLQVAAFIEGEKTSPTS